jgi:RTX calcium-binding nonapeptide repeat (4 copies)
MAKPGKKIILGDDTANTLNGTADQETIFGLGGNDTLSGWGGSDHMLGGNGNDVVNGGSGNDLLEGEAGNDTLVGEGGNDRLLGGDGNDVLLGGNGNDYLDGGAGADKFLFNRGGGVDWVVNFTAEDRIDLGAFGFASAQAVVDAFKQVGPNAMLDLGHGAELFLQNTNVSDLSTAQFDVSPYLVPTNHNSGVSFVPLMTVGDHVGNYTMAGIPDGLGAFDNGDGTFTVLMNHELTPTEGAVHDHGSTGAFISRLVIDKATLEVTEGSNLIQTVHQYDATTGSYFEATTAFNRFCSADLADSSAFYNADTGLGYNGGRLFLNGEESGLEGRAFAHIASGTEAGNSYELAWLGNMAFENVVANPHTGDTTMVGMMDDGQNGQVYFYIGHKQAGGSAIDQAGLTGGSLYGIHVNELDTASVNNNESNGTNLGGDFQSAFTLVNLGDVSGLTGAALDAASETAHVTSFLRPEDGAWDTQNPDRFYFVTTNAFGSPSRLWAVDFDASHTGGTIKMLLDGTEGQQMFDNITVNQDGKLTLCEDVGNQDHVGKLWQYDPATDVLTQIAQHDPARFDPSGAFFLTRDEESSGVIDVSQILGTNTQDAYLIDVQAHFNLGGELVQGGQLMVMYQDHHA